MSTGQERVDTRRCQRIIGIDAQVIKLNVLSSWGDFELRIHSPIIEHETFHGLLILRLLYSTSTFHH